MFKYVYDDMDIFYDRMSELGSAPQLLHKHGLRSGMMSMMAIIMKQKHVLFDAMIFLVNKLKDDKFECEIIAQNKRLLVCNTIVHKTL